MLKKLSVLFDRVISGLDVLSGILLALVVLVVCVSVFFRYVLHIPFSWTTQFTSYSLLYMVGLSSTLLLKKEGQINIDIFLNRLKPAAGYFLNFITSILGILVSLIIFWYGTKTTVELIVKNTPILDVVDIPQFTIVIIIPIAFFLLSIQFVRRAGGFYRKWRETVEGKVSQLPDVSENPR